MMEKLDDMLIIGNEKIFSTFSIEEILGKLTDQLALNPALEQDPQDAVEELVVQVAKKLGKDEQIGAILVTFNYAITKASPRPIEEEKE